MGVKQSERIAEMHTDIKWIKKELEGNGKEGLIKEVNTNTKHRIESETKGKMLNYAVGSGWGITILILILNAFGVL